MLSLISSKWIFFALGNGMLFPWNIFITCNEYFSQQLDPTQFRDNFDHYFAIGFMITNFFVLLFILMAKDSIKALTKIKASLIINALVFICCVILTRFQFHNDRQASNVFFYINMVLVVISGTSTAFLQNGVFGLVSLFGHEETTMVMSGQGLAGSLVCLLQIGSLLIGDGDHSFSAALYFSIAALVLLICIALSFMLANTDGYKKAISEQLSSINADEITDFVQESEVEDGSQKKELSNVAAPSGVFAVLGRIWVLASSVFTVYLVTLALFPAILSTVRPANESLDSESKWRLLFIPVTFLIFNLGDWLGKALPGIVIFNKFVDWVVKSPMTLKSKARLTWLMSVLRLSFIPLVLLSNTVISSDISRQFPLWINNDIGYLIIVALFAISNGYLGTLCMINGPQLAVDFGQIHAQRSDYILVDQQQLQSTSGEYAVKQYNDKDKETAGSLMVFFLTTGLTVGSLLSFVIRSSMCAWCNPFEH
ncbi:hypothetical protein MP228_006790 [Amoeboaphelidium protococcarum]|nr:hypothetical protein MP228_006790 [Amoeboaphelidium protococcarum]